MPCILLHVIEEPDSSAYEDPDLKDVVGQFPRCFCARCTPVQPLKPGEVVKCIDRTDPCWKPAGRICP
ncbi:MAG: hypothetical protein ACYC6C_12735 [Coriobacteriia bacterium]